MNTVKVQTLFLEVHISSPSPRLQSMAYTETPIAIESNWVGLLPIVVDGQNYNIHAI